MRNADQQTPSSSLSGRRTLLILFIVTALSAVTAANAACRQPAPRPVPFDKGMVRDGCPSGYSSSGGVCTPSSSSAGFVLIKPSTGTSCPSNYSSSGAFCVAGTNACHAFVSSGGSCPSGYVSARPWCVST